MKGKAILLWLGLITLLCSCGKHIPAITQEELNQQHAVLMITPPQLSGAALSSVQKALLSWRQTQNISYEWIQDTAQFRDDMIQKMNSVPYDYIIVMGKSLIAQAHPLAGQISDKKWIFLDDGFSANGLDSNGGNVAYRSISANLLQTQWSDWVHTQQQQGAEMEWVTDTSKPIPSAWAPSEESDHIVYTDSGSAWFKQLTFQVQQHNPKWIVLFTNVDAPGMQRLKSLNIPIMNMAADKIDMNWDLILNDTSNMISKNQWRSGLQPYTNEEVEVLHK